MKIINNIKIALVASVVAFSSTSCNDWLQVEMQDAIMENTLFSTDDGYLTALNGCYARLNENYESKLTMGAIDVMAQYYHVSPLENHSMYNYSKLKYDQLEAENDDIWTKQYSNIANINTILAHVDKDGTLSKKYYNYVKGEALALRAFLHFDLMRLYGPIYNEKSANTITIPYQESDAKDIQPLLPAKDVMDKIIRDLNQAIELLKADRLLVDGVKMESVSDEKPALRYRQCRLNYMAAKALLARVYMWVGDKANAKTVAEEIRAENKIDTKDEEGNVTNSTPIFPWVNKNDINDPVDGNPDRLFTSEVMFAVYDSKRDNFYNSHFGTTLNMNSALFFSNWSYTGTSWDYSIGGYPTYNYNKMSLFEDDINDYRRRLHWAESKINGGDEESWSGFYLLKFSPLQNTSESSLTDVSKLQSKIIPLIRLSEIYTILAECALDEGDMQKALDFLNEIRVHRNTPNIELTDTDTKETVKDYITMEFMREVIGEGQLFFYYKRNAMEKVMNDACTDKAPTKAIDLGDYVWPMPNVEIDKRVSQK